MTSEGLGEMFEGDFSETCGNKIPLALTGGRADLSSVCGQRARTPIGASKFIKKYFSKLLLKEKTQLVAWFDNILAAFLEFPIFCKNSVRHKTEP